MTAPLIDRTPTVRVDEGDHAVHVRHHRAKHTDLALIEFRGGDGGSFRASTSTFECVIAGSLETAAHFETHPGPVSCEGSDHDEFADLLVADRRHRRDDQIQVIGMKEGRAPSGR